MHPVFATAREIAADIAPALRPLLSPSWTRGPERQEPPRRPSPRPRGGKLVVARVHGGFGAFV